MTNHPPPDPGTAPAGWYPVPGGMQRYWDGSEWTTHTAPAVGGGPDDNTLALLAHVLGMLTGFVGPLVIYLIKRDDSAYVRHHAAEALNFQITLAIAGAVSFVLMLVLIGFVLILAVAITGFVLEIMAAVAASRGEWYRYPVCIRFVS